MASWLKQCTANEEWVFAIGRFLGLILGVVLKEFMFLYFLKLQTV